MNILREGNLEIQVNDAATWKKFDDPKLHGLSHCMKAVDFIIEFSDRIFFLEIKDPEAPKARPKNSRVFTENFKTTKLDNDLIYNFRDSFLYEWACNNIQKPIYYLIIVAIDKLSESELLTTADRLKRNIPVSGPTGVWKRSIVENCMVFNIKTWNRHFPQYPVSRVLTGNVKTIGD